ncbi:MAG: glutamate--tRNA ligase [Candidatus Aenigmatarchaeota archaeon]
MELRKIVLKHAIINAADFNGKASAGSVIGKVIAEEPEAKKDMAALGKLVVAIVKDVNGWSASKQKDELAKFGKIAKPKKEEKKGLPELENAKSGKVIMRMAPNPTAPMHIGHCRMVILNDEYVRKYKGKLILRFDDTDPKNPNKVPMKEAYAWMEEGLKWLGVKYSKVIRASSRIETYYKYFKEILGKGFAYVCTCGQEEWSEMVRVGRGTCPCRDNSKEKNLELWEKMQIGELKEGQAVGRIKTPQDIADPAVLDWVAFRIVDNPQHPFEPDVHVWPMLDFASAIDDKEFGITHILRGKDLMISEARQRILYQHMGWDYPHTTVYGKLLSTEDMVISKSKALEGMRKGIYSGWDDPRLVFLPALKRRGIQPQAIRSYMLALGLNTSETTLDLNILYTMNRELIDSKANRYFFLAEPVEIELDQIPVKMVKAPVYPGKKTYRSIPVSKKMFIEKTDFIANRGKEVRLMHMANFILDSTAKFTGMPVKDTPKLHWVGQKNVPVEIVTQLGKKVRGIAEPDIIKAKVDDMVQFERISFARCDSVKPHVFYLAHK